METAIITEKYSKAVQRTIRESSCPISEDILRMYWLNKITQIDEQWTLLPSSSQSNHALQRLEFIKTNECYQEEEITTPVFQNSAKAIYLLDNFIQFLHPDEIGPSGNGTILMTFENSMHSLTIDIGKTIIAHVYHDGENTFNSGSSKFSDNTYWDKLIDLFDNVFNG